MKLFLTISLLIKFYLFQPNYFVEDNYQVQFKCEKHTMYDSSQKINNFIIHGHSSDSSITEEMKTNFLKAFITSIVNEYDVLNYTKGNDSAFILCKNFTSNSEYARFNFTKQQYLFTNDSLFKKIGSNFINLFEIKLTNSNSYLIDSVTYTGDKVIIDSYECEIAISKTLPDKKYFICKTLPKSITPGIFVINSKGAILQVISDDYVAKLVKITKRQPYDIMEEM